MLTTNVHKSALRVHHGSLGYCQNKTLRMFAFVWLSGVVVSYTTCTTIDYRIFYILCLIMHFVHTNRVPQYLSDCVQTVACSSNRPGLRSSYTAAYAKPRCRTKFGERGFHHAGPIAWNSLPDYLHQINDTSLFKRHLKTELFRRAYHR